MDKNPVADALEHKLYHLNKNLRFDCDLIDEYYFEPMDPMEFYTEIFNNDLAHEEMDSEGSCTPGKYIAIATIIKTKINAKGEKYTVSQNEYIYDGLDKIDSILYDDGLDHEGESGRLTILSPVSYAGRRRLSINARFMYALCIEIDGLRKHPDGYPIGLAELLYQCAVNKRPKPTYIAASGHGVHLYYKFVKPIPCFENVRKSLNQYKKALTYKLWNRYVTIHHEKSQVQIQSAFQGFRMVGTRTKNRRDCCRVYRIGEPVSIDYMNSFVSKDNQIVVLYKSDLTLKEAQTLYPKWYERRIVEGIKERGHWISNRKLYDWWLRTIKDNASVGHRYFCVMCLCIYAVKCGIEEDELTRDCFSLVEYFDKLTVDEDNHFTLQDVDAAMDLYRNKGENMYTYSSEFISKKSGIELKKNKRNGRSKEEHIQFMNGMKELRLKLGEDVKGGRPKNSGTKQSIVEEWKVLHPEGKRADCIRDTGLSKHTVYKWWDASHLDLQERPEVPGCDDE